MKIKLIDPSTFNLLLIVIIFHVNLIEPLNNGSNKLTDKSFSLISTTKLPTTINRSHYHHPNDNRLVNYVRSLPGSTNQATLISPNTGLITLSKYYNHKRQGKDIFDGWGGYPHHPDKDEDVSKTFSYLMPILLLIAAVTLTIPLIALFFFIFLWKRPPSFLCNVLDPELKNINSLNAQPRVYNGLINLLLKVDKAFSKGDHDYGSSIKR